MASLVTKKIAVNAGSQEPVQLSGNYLRLVNSIAGVNIKTENNDNFYLENGEDLLFNDSGFNGLYVTSVSTEVVELMIGNNVKFSAPKINGSVEIVSQPAIEILNDVQIITGNFQVWTSKATLAANVAVQVVNPADNTAGLIVHDVNLTSYTNAFSHVLTAKNSAPANTSEGLILNIAKVSASAAYIYQNIENSKKVKIPSGLGLYFICDGTEFNSQKHVIYELL